MDIYVKFTMSLTKYGHVTCPGFKFRNVYFLSNSILNFRKSYEIWGKLAQEQKSYRQKIN